LADAHARAAAVAVWTSHATQASFCLPNRFNAPLQPSSHLPKRFRQLLHLHVQVCRLVVGWLAIGSEQGRPQQPLRHRLHRASGGWGCGWGQQPLRCRLLGRSQCAATRAPPATPAPRIASDAGPIAAAGRTPPGLGVEGWNDDGGRACQFGTCAHPRTTPIARAAARVYDAGLPASRAGRPARRPPATSARAPAPSSRAACPAPSGAAASVAAAPPIVALAASSYSRRIERGSTSSFPGGRRQIALRAICIVGLCL
jgi:hypothetical protein